MPGHTAKVMLRFIDRTRVAAAHDTECEPDQNPLQRAYQVSVSKLSDEERGELVRIINKLSQQLEEREFRGAEGIGPGLTGHPDQRRASPRLQTYDDPV
jgi:hypothetical protein